MFPSTDLSNSSTDIGWNDVPRDDPKIIRLREHLISNSGIKGLEILGAADVERIVELFCRDGFVLVDNILNEDQIAFLASGCETVVNEIVSLDKKGKGNRGSHRYSFGGSSRDGWRGGWL